MKIYNTLTRQKEILEPIEEGIVKIYVCGPTVYNYIHIGNARPYIIFDTVRRYLEYKGLKVKYVQNFTDIDDKIIKKANEEGISAREVAKKYIEEVFVDADALGIRRADVHPKATEEIPEMVEMIEKLIGKGYAYEVNGTVYFETNKFKEYGKLSKKNIEELATGIRIAVNDEKRNPTDFVLWKPKKEGEPSWESPWGEGRPGWHIECSVMSKKYLGDRIDIHAGGVDLIFPHHENEIAQSEAANGVDFVKYWIHNGLINVDNKKMSKSLDNFFTVRDIAKDFPYEVIRFFMLNAHYRSPINFSRELMKSATNGLDRIKMGMFNLEYLLEKSETHTLVGDEKNLIKESDKYRIKFENAMDDDFNTADAVSAVFEFIRFANTHTNGESSKAFLQKIIENISRLCDILGIITTKEKLLIDEEIEGLIGERQKAREDRNFALADKIRDELIEKGIILEDTREGTRWSRRNV